MSKTNFRTAITALIKLANENPTFAEAHDCLAKAYWGKRMYPKVIEEWKAFGNLSGDRNESDFAAAVEQEFHSRGWKGALTKGIEIRQAQRKTGYFSPFTLLLSSMPTWERKIRLFSGSTPPIKSAMYFCRA
jgi:hypothetical protein